MLNRVEFGIRTRHGVVLFTLDMSQFHFVSSHQLQPLVIVDDQVNKRDTVLDVLKNSLGF